MEYENRYASKRVAGAGLGTDIADLSSGVFNAMSNVGGALLENRAAATDAVVSWWTELGVMAQVLVAVAIDAATMGFYIANEGISILENTALLGVPWPEGLKRALEALKKDD